MKRTILVFSALLIAAPCSAVYADSITGTLVDPNASYDLNDYDAFGYYGDPNVALYTHLSSAAPSTDSSNLGDLSSLTYIGGYLETSSGSPSVVSFTGASGPVSSETDENNFYFVQTQGNGIGFSLTSTLFAPTETFQFVLEDYNTESDLTASLNDVGSTSYSLTNQVLPEPWPGDTSANDNTIGLLTLTVTGAVGEVLTFKDVEASPSSNGNVGIEALTIDVPEPRTYALMGVGALLLVLRLRRKNGIV